MQNLNLNLKSSLGLPRWCSGKESACQHRDARDTISIPGLGQYPAGGNGNPLQHSCLENPMDRGAWWATVYRVAKNQTWLNRLSMTEHPVSQKNPNVCLRHVLRGLITAFILLSIKHWRKSLKFICHLTCT